MAFKRFMPLDSNLDLDDQVIPEKPCRKGMRYGIDGDIGSEFEPGEETDCALERIYL
jgi:hypothetical protein